MEAWFAAWFSLLPFVSLYSVYEGPKIVWVWLGGAGLSIMMIRRLWNHAPLFIGKADRWFLGWLVALTISSVAGIHPVESLLGGSYRHQGVLFFFTMFLIAFVQKTLSSEARTRFHALLGVAVIAESVFLLVQKTAFPSERAWGTFGEPNGAAGYLAVGLYWIVSAGNMRLRFKGLLTVMILGAIVATGSRTGLCAAAVLLCFSLIPYIRAKRISPASLGVVLGVAAGFVAAGIVYVRVVSITRPVSPFENRKEFASVGLAELKKRPFFGYGAESLEILYERAYAGKSFPLAGFMIDRSHNVFLDVALWSGIAGAGVFTVWLLQLLRTAWITRDTQKIGFLAAWLLFACFQPVGAVQWLMLFLVF